MSELIPKNETTEQQHDAVELFKKVQDGLSLPIAPIYLGVTYRKGGGFTEKNEAKILVSEANMVVELHQSAHGYTGLWVEPLKGYDAAALSIDTETKALSWIRPREGSAKTVVSKSDSVLLEHNDAKYFDASDPNHRISDEEIHSGIVRITGPDSVQYYIVSADFSGDADNWNITGAITEVFPTNALEAPDQQIES